MSTNVELLSSERRIGLLGDLHGDFFHTKTVLPMLASKGIRAVIQLGDFGFIWPGEQIGKNLHRLNRVLDANDMVLFVVDGNHEDHDRLAAYRRDSDGIRWVKPRIGVLPRGFRAQLASGRTLAALGGANSIDRYRRNPGRSWWPGEQITEADLAALGTDPVDVLVGHDAPADLAALDAFLAANAWMWDRAGLAYAEQGRTMFHRGFLNVRPKLSVSGHYHRFTDELVTHRAGDDTFECRSVVLDMNGAKVSQAILDVDDLTLEFLARGGALQQPTGNARLA